MTASGRDDAESSRLPTGVTLLESDRYRCDGPVSIDDGSIAGRRDEDAVVQPGQNAVFELDVRDKGDINIGWTCVGAADAEEESADCPRDTSHIRITRASEDDFLLECFGQERAAG
jgi:hypothetical protein